MPLNFPRARKRFGQHFLHDPHVIARIIAAIGLISTFALLTSALYFTFPVGRFLGLAWLIAASILLPRSRHEVRRAARPTDGSSAVTSGEREVS